MLTRTIPEFISMAFVLLVGLTFHEFAHAAVADYFGDDTPRMHGRLTLNPLKHLDPVGSLMLLFAGFGWAKPVPINPYLLEHRSRSATMLVALAGPVSNLALAVVAAIPVMLGLIPEVNTTSQFLPSAYDLITTFVLFNLILFLFNLIPLFPLDGEKVAMYFLPASVQDALARARRFGPLPLILIVMVLPIMGFPILTWLVFNPATWLARLLLL